MKWAIALIILAGALAAGITAMEEDIAIGDLPEVVRAAAEKEASGNALTEAERVKTKDGVFYEVEWDVDGDETEVLISATGEIVRRGDDDDDGEDDDDETPVKSGDVPRAVKDAAQKALPGNAKIKGFTTEEENGQLIYEAAYAGGGSKGEIAITVDGSVFEQEEEVSTKQLPAAVAASLESRYPNAEIDEAELVRVTFYEVELETDAGEIEVMVRADGHVLGEEHED